MNTLEEFDLIKGEIDLLIENQELKQKLQKTEVRNILSGAQQKISEVKQILTSNKNKQEALKNDMVGLVMEAVQELSAVQKIQLTDNKNTVPCGILDDLVAENLITNLTNVAAAEIFGDNTNYQLSVYSPGKNAGTDGTDIGVYGGTNPWKGNYVPVNPSFTKFLTGATSDFDDKLKVDITAEAQKK